MSGRFVIRNGSRWPDDEVKELVRFAMQDVDTRALCVNVKRLRGATWKGWAYEGVPWYLVTLQVGESLRYPVKPKTLRRGEPDFVLNDWRETMVFLAAHEAKHIEQYRENKSRSEVRCNTFAAHMLDRFRLVKDDLMRQP